jgi:hypothetical protein
MEAHMKDYLGFENQRNKQHADLYTRFLRAAIPESGVAVLVGHHVTFEIGGDLMTENEIPSADTLMFDHDLMKAVFGERAIAIMQKLASVPCEERDHLLGWYMDHEAAVKDEAERLAMAEGRE